MRDNTPVYTAIKNYVEQKNLRLHMPGHLGGRGMAAEELQKFAELDITEIEGVGDLHTFTGAVEEGRQLLAQAFKASESLFLVNGATSGIHTLFMTLNPGEKILVPRDAHRSFFEGMVLSGVEPVYVPKQMDPEFGVSVPLRVSDINRAMIANPDVKAIFLLSPNYFGMTCDIASVVGKAHHKDQVLPVFVDEAHGGHFVFHDQFPPSALCAGADAAVNGLHKTLPVLNQGGCLHVARKKLFHDKVYPAWSLLTTTSPSFPVLASIDMARSFMVEQGHELLEQALMLSRQYRQEIGDIKGLRVYKHQQAIAHEGLNYDPLKLLISIEGLCINGIQTAEILKRNYKIQMEAHGQQYVLAMMSMFHHRDEWQRLEAALREIATLYPGPAKKGGHLSPEPQPEMVLTPREAFFACKRVINFADCKGEIAGEMIAPYPPGVPCVLPGEKINEEVFEYLQEVQAHQITLHGLMDRHLTTIAVIDEFCI